MPERIDPRRIPIIGNTIYNAGQVLDIIAVPCSPQPWIMVQATFTYLPTLAFALLKPEPLDLAFDRAGRRHRRVRRRRMNVAETIRLPQPERGTTGWFLFRVAEIGQRVGWYFLVADATVDFALSWTSMVYEWGGCIEPSNGYARCWNAVNFIARAAGPTTSPVVFDDWESDGPAFASASGVGITAIGPKICMVNARFEVLPWAGNHGTIERVYLEANIEGIGLRQLELTNNVQTGNETEWTVPFNLDNPQAPLTSWTLHVDWTGGELRCVYGEIQALGARPGGILPDP